MMEDFVFHVYDWGSNINTMDNDSALKLHREEQQTTTCQNEAQDSESPDDHYEVLSLHTETIQDNTSKKSKRAEAIPASQRQKQRQLTREIDDAQDKILKTLKTLKNVLSAKKEDYECDLFGKLLVNKLRVFHLREAASNARN